MKTNKPITMKTKHALCAILVMGSASSGHAGLKTFNSAGGQTNNATTRTTWLSAVGISTPASRVDFESGFSDNQNISGVSGLFPRGLVIRDTSSANQAIVLSGSGVIGGSNPVRLFALTQNPAQPYLVLDFSALPVDYVAFQDIDTPGTSVRIFLVGGAMVTFSLDNTAGSGDSAEFFGIFRNDLPQITRVELGASGDIWGIDTIEYGPTPLPEPGTALFGIACVGVAALRRRRRA